MDFSINGNTLTVTITNTHAYNLLDSQNITAVAFQVSTGSGFRSAAGSTTTTHTGASVLNNGGSSNVSLNTVLTPGTDNVTWDVTNLGTNGTFGAGNVNGGGNNVALGTDAFILSATTAPVNFHPGTGTLQSIIGPTNASGAYDGNDGGAGSACTGTGGKVCNTGFPIESPFYSATTGLPVASCSGPGCLAQDTSQFLYNSAVFSFTITGLTATTGLPGLNRHRCLSQYHFRSALEVWR